MIDDEGSLRDRYRAPHDSVIRKCIDRVDEGAAGFLAASPLVVVATSGPDGADASPRGGPPGFVVVLDEGRIAFGDLAGNNRLDSFANLTHDPEVGLLFLVPGVEETLRVNGRASLSTDEAVLDATAIDGRRPKLAVVVDVRECYIHCGKALRRSGAWEPDRWLPPEERPDAVKIFVDHARLPVDPAAVAAELDEAYDSTLWEPGGDA